MEERGQRSRGWPKSGQKVNYVFGEYRHTLDEKNRLLIPAKFRPFLEEGFVFLRGHPNCIYVIPMSIFEPVCRKLASLPFDDAKSMRIRRYFGSAQEGRMDKQGRMVIPENLRRHAHIEKEVIIAGRFTHIEIWSPGAWANYESQHMRSELIQKDLSAASIPWPIGTWEEEMEESRDEGEAFPPPRPGRGRGQPP